MDEIRSSPPELVDLAIFGAFWTILTKNLVNSTQPEQKFHIIYTSQKVGTLLRRLVGWIFMMSLVFSFWVIVVSLAAVEWFLLLGDAAHRGPSGKGFSHNPLMSILCQIWDVFGR